MLPHPLNVLHVGGERYFLRANPFCGTSPSALIVIDDAESIRESVQVRQEIAVVEIGAAMEDDDGLSLADRSGIQRRCADRDTALVRPLGYLLRAC